LIAVDDGEPAEVFAEIDVGLRDAEEACPFGGMFERR